MALESDNDAVDTIALFQALMWKHEDALLLADSNGCFQDANKATDSFLVVIRYLLKLAEDLGNEASLRLARIETLALTIEAVDKHTESLANDSSIHTADSNLPDHFNVVDLNAFDHCQESRVVILHFKLLLLLFLEHLQMLKLAS